MAHTSLRRRTTTALLSFALALACADLPRTRASAAETAPGVRFAWAMLALVAGTDGANPVPIQDGATLKTGDGLRLVIERRLPCYLYVLHRSPDGVVTRLFPPTDAELPGTILANLSIPSEQGWLWLDDARGAERFFLVASPEPLPKLETLLALYETANPGLKTMLADDVEREIARLRRQHQPLAKEAERPATIAGMVRGLRGSQDPVAALEIASDDVYVKVLTIEHR